MPLKRHVDFKSCHEIPFQAVLALSTFSSQLGNIEYRILDYAYLTELSELEKECQHSPWSTSLIEKELRSSRTVVQGMFLDRKLIAYLVYQIVLDEAHVLNFGVKKDYRRRGLGKRFMCKAMEDFRRDEVEIVTLEVRESNLAAQELYRSVGFKAVGCRENYYSNNSEAAVLMTCKFS